MLKDLKKNMEEELKATRRMIHKLMNINKEIENFISKISQRKTNTI